MPITGLPVIVENALCTLMHECSLSSYKIVANDNGSSTVVLRFATIVKQPDAAIELSPGLPRGYKKSPSQLRRDQQRKAIYTQQRKVNTFNLASTPASRSQSPPSSPNLNVCLPTVSTTDPWSSSQSDSGIEYSRVLTPAPRISCAQLPPPPQQQGTYTDVCARNQYVREHGSPQNKECVDSAMCVSKCVNVVSDVETPLLNSCSNLDCRPENMTDKSMNTNNDQIQLCYTDISEKEQLENKSEQDNQHQTATRKAALLFKSVDNFEKSKEYARRLPRYIKEKFKNPKKNDRLHQIAFCQYSPEEGGRTLVASTQDLLFTYHTDIDKVGTMAIAHHPIPECKQDTYYAIEFDRWPVTLTENDLNPDDRTNLRNTVKDLLEFIIEQ